MEDLADNGFRFRGEGEFNALTEHGVDRTESSGNIIEDFSVVPNSS